VTTEVFDSESQLASALADRVLAAIVRQPDLVLGLPTGRTPRLLYQELGARSRRAGTDWSRVRTFNLDEFVGLGGHDPGSYYHYMEQALFSVVGLPRDHIGFLDGRAVDFDVECRRFEQAIRDAGGIDLMILGIGVNGHIGFNEPGPWLHARTHRAALAPATRAANAGLFGGDSSRVPREGLSMGMATILQSRAVVLIATGDEKAAALAAMVEGPLTTAVPASFLQLHADVTLMIDRPASEAGGDGTPEVQA
jgi:glucosamine-6-phosphate deaminase